MAEGFILANCSRPINLRVSAVKGRCKLTTSLRLNSSSSLTAFLKEILEPSLDRCFRPANGFDDSEIHELPSSNAPQNGGE
jgi:hypothetical protein